MSDKRWWFIPGGCLEDTVRLRSRVTELEVKVANLEAKASANEQDHNRLNVEIAKARAKANTNEALIRELTTRLWPMFVAGVDKLAEVVEQSHSHSDSGDGDE